MIRDNLGDRMKRYEAVSKTILVSRMPVMVRLDICHAHSFCKGFIKPFDQLFSKTMQATMKYLCKSIQGCVLGYTQSDEITLVLIDYKKLNSNAWFDNEVQKITSVSAAIATYAFNKYFNEYYLESIANKREVDTYDLAHDKARKTGAYFDSRAFNIPKEEVTNCILWRQLDAERNSILAVAQANYTQKELQKISCKKLVSKLEAEKGIIWGELPTTQKRGSCCIRRCASLKDFCDQKTIEDFQSGKILCPQIPKEVWYIDNDIPRFIDEGRDYIEKLVYPKDEE